jgi:hypothetical protein
MSETPASPDSLERCYRIKELQALTGLSDRSLRRLFENEPGVIVLAEKTGKGARRRYRTITIPESVVRRVLGWDGKGS